MTPGTTPEDTTGVSAPTVPTTVVVPTIGRPSLVRLLDSLAAQRPAPAAIIVVDDRPDPASGTILDDVDHHSGVTIRRARGAGPAAARNLGWRHARTPWVSFLDDDVVVDPDWTRRLAEDLDRCTTRVAATQGAVHVPLPMNRRPTDWERTTAGLSEAWCITADLTCRRSALAEVGGFDERFRRAYREDADLGLRLHDAGWRIVAGTRQIRHPVRPAGFWVSVTGQAGNADDMLMRRLHGPVWQERAAAPRGRRRRHVAITLAAVVATTAAVTGHRRTARIGTALWLAGTAEFAAARIVPGPRTPAEMARMLVTSAVIPFAASWHTLRGKLRYREAGRWHGLPDLVLFDRDGTLVHDVPYNGDPDRVRLMPGAATAVTRLRDRGVRVGVVTNQSGVARGLLTQDDVQAVHHRIDDLLGPIDVWQYCPHAPDDACGCRKPAPGMVEEACAELGVDAGRCVVVGDIGSDVAAATAAGAHAILIPTAVTKSDEIAAAPRRAGDLNDAVDLVLGGAW